MKRLLDPLARAWRWPWLVCAAVLVWKLALFALATLPPPANDSFFYDGPVVNLLLHGRYVNPALTLALPISATEVFCAYPPLYQGVLLAWMSVFGPSVQAAMTLHLALFAGGAVLVVATLRRLGAPGWAINTGCLFLLAATFHDRPDTLAQTLGLTAVYCLVRGRAPNGEARTSGWHWGMAAAAVLGLACSLQFGATFFLLLGGALLADRWLRGRALPWGPLAVMALAPVALIVAVKLGAPRWWEGFLEHAQQTPSLTGLRMPSVNDLLKIGRNVPGVFGAAVLAVWWIGRRGGGGGREGEEFVVPLSASGLLVALAVTVGALVALTANVVLIPVSLQPLVVAGWLTVFAAGTPNAACGHLRPAESEHAVGAAEAAGARVSVAPSPLPPSSMGERIRRVLIRALNLRTGFRAERRRPRRLGSCEDRKPPRTAALRFMGRAGAVDEGVQSPSVRTLGWTFALLAALSGVRAVGLSTWGLACAADVTCGQALERVRREVAALPAGETVALSSAYLYAGATRGDVRWIHCDWLSPARHDVPDRDLRGLLETRPAKLVLTQFDYYRRYEPLLREVRGRPEARTVRVENTARTRAPDSIPAMQRVLQHVAWAPVVVDLDWAAPP